MTFLGLFLSFESSNPETGNWSTHFITLGVWTNYGAIVVCQTTLAYKSFKENLAIRSINISVHSVIFVFSPDIYNETNG